MRAEARNWVGASIKRAGERMGLEVRRHHAPGPRRADLLARHGISVAIDVGANRGQYAQELRRHGFRGQIVSFEPLDVAFGALNQAAAADAQWTVHRVAVSDAEGSVELHAADNFSSTLPIAERLAGLFPEAVPTHRERVRSLRLDTPELGLPPAGDMLLKIDVQGGEPQVLSGAAGILHRVKVIETELSIAPLYAGQALLGDVVRILGERSYSLVALDPVLRDRRSGEYLQFDGLFERS